MGTIPFQGEPVMDDASKWTPPLTDREKAAFLTGLRQRRDITQAWYLARDWHIADDLLLNLSNEIGDCINDLTKRRARANG